MNEGRRGFDVAVVGGGIVGLATARALALGHDLAVVVLEAEDGLARHQSGRNSGVIHSGLYYRPGSAKAELCVAGRDAMYAYCAARGIRHQRCGKVVVATSEEELPRLDELERRGRANALAGVARLSPAELRDHEPHAAGLAALWVPQTGVVDYREVTRAFAADLAAAGGEVRTASRLLALRREAGGLRLTTAAGTLEAAHLVNCAGLQSDRVARLCGIDPEVRIVPFRGEYYELEPAARDLVRHLVYPVPDPRFPFLGVHFTRAVDGRVEAGPNAVLALAREGYTRASFSLRDSAATLAWPGFWRLARRFAGVAYEEMRRSWSRRLFAASLARLVPEIRASHLRPGGAGVRAQAVGRDGALLDDFHIVEAERMVHVLNAPSPAATASLAIGGRIAAMAGRVFGIA